ncbi:5660_t:CDS:2 [Cetraspora pellucida]|uniref:5660_t:CDS:1 n=1 Tax=Cetraspora pellucida TaxID=1433469 RepID=A0A9N8WFQ2_9GLOM|nr:5660_t:CDS:2 [Cetraspora pellucida]
MGQGKFCLNNAPNQTTLSQILAKKDEYLKMDDEKDLKARKSDIYKVDQLKAMQCSSTIHEVHPNNKVSLVVVDLEELLRLLSSHHLISLAYFTNLSEEMDMVHQKFTDADLLELAASENKNSANELNDLATSVIIFTN